MSVEKNFSEVNGWIQTAMEELASATILKENGKYAHACFHAKQISERALRAIWSSMGEDPWRFAMKRLIFDLDNTYLRPDDIFFETDAKSCISQAEEILKTSILILQGK